MRVYPIILISILIETGLSIVACGFYNPALLTANSNATLDLRLSNIRCSDIYYPTASYVEFLMYGSPINYYSLVNLPVIVNGTNGERGADGRNGTNGVNGVNGRQASDLGLCGFIIGVICLFWLICLTIYVCCKSHKKKVLTEKEVQPKKKRGRRPNEDSKAQLQFFQINQDNILGPMTMTTDC